MQRTTYIINCVILSYCSFKYGGSGVPPVYLAGTVLLETYVRYGSISFNTEDIFQEEGGWRPTAKQMSDLMSGFKSIRLKKLSSVLITEEFLIRLSR